MSNNRKALKRLHSGPFLRKPVPPPQLDDPVGSPSSSSLQRRSSSSEGSDPLGTSSTSSNSNRSTRRRVSSRQTYNSIESDDRHDLQGSASSPSHADDGDHISNHLEIEQSHDGALERHLSLVDLIAIGVGGTIGSGLFVLAGLVAHEYAGPSTIISWAISGATACLSGCCYAELSARIPLSGSAYAYSYVAMGELPAVLAAACLSLEYIAASAAVSDMIICSVFPSFQTFNLHSIRSGCKKLG